MALPEAGQLVPFSRHTLTPPTVRDEVTSAFVPVAPVKRRLVAKKFVVVTLVPVAMVKVRFCNEVTPATFNEPVRLALVPVAPVKSTFVEKKFVDVAEVNTALVVKRFVPVAFVQRALVAKRLVVVVCVPVAKVHTMRDELAVPVAVRLLVVIPPYTVMALVVMLP